MAQRSDQQIQADITEHLRSAGLALTVTVENGVLRLEGTVTSEEEREAALDLASWVEDVREVVDDMELREFDVDSPDVLFSAVEEVDEDMDMTDDPMVAAAEGLPYFPPTDPPVGMDETSDDLEVASGFQSTSLEDDYEDQEIVQDEPVGDEELVERVLANLRQDARTSDLRLFVTARNGRVVLTGVVHDNLESDSAVEVADTTPGVAEVIDRTVLTSPVDVPVERRPLPQRAQQMTHVVTPSAAWRATVIANHFRLDQMRDEARHRLANLEKDLKAYGEDQEQEGAGSSHEGDLGTDLAASGAILAEVHQLRDELQEIDDALERMAKGTYGICIDTGKLIEPARLKANPLAVRTLEAQRRYEDRLG